MKEENQENLDKGSVYSMQQELEAATRLGQFVDDLNAEDRPVHVQKEAEDTDLAGLFNLARGFKTLGTIMPQTDSAQVQQHLVGTLPLSSPTAPALLESDHEGVVVLPLAGGRPVQIRRWRGSALVGLALVAVLAFAVVAVSVAVLATGNSGSSTNSANPTVPVLSLDQSRPITGTLRATFSGHSGTVRTVKWSPDGSVIVSSGEDGTVRMWSPQGRLLQTLVDLDGSPFTRVAWSPDGKLLAAGNGSLWNARGELQTRIDGFSDWVGDSDTVAVVQDSDIIVRHLSDQRVNRLNLPNGVWNLIAFSPDGKTLAAGSLERDTPLTPGENGSYGPSNVRFRLAKADGTPMTVFKGYGRPIYALAWTADSQLVASSSKGVSTAGIVGGEQVRIWQANGTVGASIGGDYGVVTAMAWSPDGKILAGTCSDDAIRLWSREGKLLATIADKIGSAEGMAWSPDGRTLASGSGNTVKLWQIENR